MALYCLVMVAIGLWSYRKVGDSHDFFVAGGRMPWWLSGISHHMSGYSAAVFVAHAGVAYSYGFTLYMWWALPISIAVFGGAIWIAPKWARSAHRVKHCVPYGIHVLAVQRADSAVDGMEWSHPEAL